MEAFVHCSIRLSGVRFGVLLLTRNAACDTEFGILTEQGFAEHVGMRVVECKCMQWLTGTR